MSEHDPDAAGPEPRGLFDGPKVIDHHPGSDPAPVVVARRRGGTPLPLTLLLTAGLGGAGYWAWSHPMAAPPARQDTQLGEQLRAVAGRVDALEKHNGAEAGDAAAEQTKRVDALSARVDTLAGKQDQMQAEAAKAVEIAGQKTPSADGAAPPPDQTAKEVPGLIAQQKSSDAAEVNHAPGQATVAPGTALAGQGVTPDAASNGAALAGQKTALDSLEQRVAKLEASPPPPAQPVAPAAAPDADAEKALQTAQQGDAAALAALGDRLAKLEQASGQVQSQDAEAQKAQQQALQAQQGDATALAALTERLGRLEQASGQVQSQDETVQKAQADSTATLATLAGRVEKLEQGAGQAQGAASGAARDATRAIQLQAAAAALQAGQPLGAIAGAPPALSRYATVAPPTEAGLRAEYPRVADSARAVSQTDTAHRSFVDRALARLQQSVVVRQGDHVVVGDPAAGVLARAQDSVLAGDLKGAADTLGGLTGPAADAVRPWVAQVHALLAARAALGALAAGG